MIRMTIIFVIANYPLTFLVVGLIVSAIAIARTPRPVGGAVIVDKFLAWYVFFNTLCISSISSFMCFLLACHFSSSCAGPLPLRKSVPGRSWTFARERRASGVPRRGTALNVWPAGVSADGCFV
jgi:hypothetical protein